MSEQFCLHTSAHQALNSWRELLCWGVWVTADTESQGAVSTPGSSQILVWLRGTESSFPTSLATVPHNLARPGFSSLGGLLIISRKCENHKCYNRDFHFMFLFQTHVWLKCFYRATQSIKAQYVHTAVKINGEKRSSWTCHLMSTIAWEQKD